MSCRRKSISCESQAKCRRVQDDLKSVSVANLSDNSSETILSSATRRSLNADDLFAGVSTVPCEEVINALEYKSDEDVKEIFPCNSCEFIEPIERVETTYCCGLCKSKTPWKKISEYWLISVPKDEKTVEILNAATKNLSYNYKFHTPMLKVGILNTLIELTEHLKTLDKFVKDVVENVVNNLKNEIGSDTHELAESLKINNLSPATYLTRFQWNRSKYPSWHQISIIADHIYSYVDGINECMKQKHNLLEKINASIRPYEQRETESLKLRYLGDIVKKEHFVVDSNFLTSLLVVVPNRKIKLWKSTYTTLGEMVVPNSSIKIFSDHTHTLYSVTLPIKDVELFKRNARQQDFIVRDYKYSEKHQKAEKEHYENLATAKANVKSEILRWSKIMFGEAFEAWMHVKTLRVFVESVVRFGLPVNYQAILILPLKSKTTLKRKLRKLYKTFDAMLSENTEHLHEGLAAFYDVEEYYPFVYFNINLEFLYK